MSRADKTEATRVSVIAAARTLFLDLGYAGTTTREVAARAGVTERTLFNIVANKSELLRAVLFTYVWNDDRGPLLERRDFAATLTATTVKGFLGRYTRWVLELHTRTSPVAEMTRAAASVDAVAADIWTWGNAQQIIDLRSLAKVLQQRGWLREGLSPADVAYSFAVLSGHETYWRLVNEQRWSRVRYRRWLSRHCGVELR